MKGYSNVSAQMVSWVKTDKSRLEAVRGIEKLFYPSSMNELKMLLLDLIKRHERYDTIGYASNTLFRPSYHVRNLICTKYVNEWYETDNAIVCDCGVPIGPLSREMVKKGYAGFEGLCDLPGTVAAGVYGNAGCRGCSVLSLVQSFSIMDEAGSILEFSPEDLKPDYRTTNLKRGLLKGVILQVVLNKVPGNAVELADKAEYHHQYRMKRQPDGANNLGTTFLGAQLTTKGKRVFWLQKRISKTFHCSQRKAYKIVLKLIGKKQFVPYLWSWDRYMFLSPEAHDLFDVYHQFLNTLYSDLQLEIEVRQ